MPVCGGRVKGVGADLVATTAHNKVDASRCKKIESFSTLVSKHAHVRSQTRTCTHAHIHIRATTETHVYACACGGGLQEAEADEHEETAAASAENWVCRAACLSRSSPTTCLPFLASCMTQAKDALAHAATSGAWPYAPTVRRGTTTCASSLCHRQILSQVL